MRHIRLKVRTRIYLGFAVLVVLSLGIAAFGVYQLSGVSTNVGKMDLLATNTQRVLTITRQLEAIRRAETRYLFDATEASMKDARDNASAADALLTDAIKVVLTDERRKAYHAVQDTLRAHLTNLDQLGQLSTTWVAERARLFTGGDALTTATDKLVAAARASNKENAGNAAERVERTILLVRVANWRFIATQDSAGVGTFKTNVANARAALAEIQGAASAEVTQLIAPVQTVLAAYEASFTAYSTARLAVGALY
ncbi:MAG: MCP four helix bundle domain-containing protein, partial [Acetobacteraceae bacterium]